MRRMLFALLANLAIIGLIIFATEVLWRTKTVHVEVSRKIVHICTGVVVAFWPYFLGWHIIQALSLAMLLAIFISYRFHILKSIHSIKRLTIGEILYPVGIGLCALLQPAPWMFSVAILHLTLADGFAAIMGVRYGKKTRYTLISHGKSLIGTATFFIVSFSIFVIASFVVSENALPHVYGWFAWSALALTLIENISWYGTDDITVPVAAIIILTLLPG